MLLQPGDRVVTALANVVALVAVPSPLTGHHTGLLGKIEQTADRADAAAKQDVELRNPERRGHLVFGHLDLGPNAVFLGTALQGLDATDVEPHRGIELEGITTGGGFGVAVGDSDFLTQLVQKDHRATGLANVACDFAHGLAHQAGLAAHRKIAHLAFNFSPGSQGCNRVHNHNVHRGGSHQLVDDLQGHLAGIRLGDQQIFDVDPNGGGIDGVEGVLRIHEGSHPATLLNLSDGMQGQRGFTRTLRAINLHNPALGIAATQGEVEGERSGGERLHPHAGGIAQPHDRTLTEVALDVIKHKSEGLVALGSRPGVSGT